MSEKIALCPGSFDPITNGHLDIITSSSTLFDKVIVLVATNLNKSPMFLANERIDMIKSVTSHLSNVSVDTFSGLLVDYAQSVNAIAIVKGLRSVTDFEYEFQMALVNKKLNGNINTVFLNTSMQNMYLSSSIVKQIGSMGGDIKDFVPCQIVDKVIRRIQNCE